MKWPGHYLMPGPILTSHRIWFLESATFSSVNIHKNTEKIDFTRLKNTAYERF